MINESGCDNYNLVQSEKEFLTRIARIIFKI